MSSVGKYGFVVYPHWQYRERLANAQACQKILDASKGKGGLSVSKMIFTGNTAIILNIRHEFKLALPYAQLAWKLSDADTPVAPTPVCCDYLTGVTRGVRAYG